MKRAMGYRLWALSLLFAPVQAQSVINVPSTPALSIEQERHVQRIGAKVRCPICKGESIAQSSTDISRSMLNEVREMLRQGMTEQQILNKFRSGYGERILLEPPKSGLNVLLWGLPLGFLALGGGIWFVFLRRSAQLATEGLSEEEEKRIAQMLSERQK